MSNTSSTLPNTPWEAFPSETAPPPVAGVADTPWEFHAANTPIVQQLPPPVDAQGKVALTPQQTFDQDKSYPAGAEKPVEQKLAENAVTVGNGMALGSLGANIAGLAAKPLASIFEASPDLLNAGIKPTTILKMTPPGQNPADFGAALEDNLNQAGAIGKDAKQTFDKMDALKEAAGQKVGDSLQAISKAAEASGTPNPLAVDAQSALKPIVDAWAERAGGGLQGTRRLAKPFEEAATVLGQQAAQQGGTLTLDNVRNLMDEVGPLTHKGSEQAQAAYADLYHTLANTRDSMVQNVAEKAGDPTLSQNLLSANKDYSTYMRLMPDVSKSAAQYAVKQGVSTFQKYGGPTILKYAAGAAGVEGLEKIVKFFEGSEK